MAAYADGLTLREARRLYFEANAFGDGSYDAKWVWLGTGPIRLCFPNTKSRVRAVRLHDLHHVVTGYDTTWTGESEIGAWEVGGDCRDHWAAWVLNLNAIALGLFIAPRATFRAYVRGRRSRNLYGGDFHERLLDEKVGSMRRRLGLLAEPTAAAPDLLSFVGVALISLAVFAVTAGLPVTALALFALSRF